MGENTKISWADDTFNPWTGCQKVGPGCDHCYAEGWAKRSGLVKWGPGEPRRRTSASNWNKPVKWNREAEASGIRRRVFCASLADVFDKAAPHGARKDLFALIRATPNLDWILVTKRIGNVAEMVPDDWGDGCPNVWLLITVVNQDEADRDIPKLLATPAAVRGLSVEPMLSEIGIEPWLEDRPPTLNQMQGPNGAHFVRHGASWIDWVICGAESGPHRRDFNEDWARSLRDQCAASGTAFFYKQIIRDGRKIETPELDGKRWVEFPDREWKAAQ